MVEQLRLFNIKNPALNLLKVPRRIEEYKHFSYSSSSNQRLKNFILDNLIGNSYCEVKPPPNDLIAGKNTYVYDAHTYHTKVPPQAIASLIDHFTEPQALVLDPFCGSGMTGVAAIQKKRKPILIDLSPAATFIAFNFLTPADESKYFQAYMKVLCATADEELLLYGTHCRKCGKLVPMNYMVWSYGLICKYCEKEFLLWNIARYEHEDVRKSKIKREFDCPHCSKHLKKSYLKRTKPYPVQVGYNCCEGARRESTAPPDEYDLALIDKINNTGIPANLWYPTTILPPGINTRQPISHGLVSIDSLYTKRQLWVMSRLWDIARRWRDEEISLKLMYTFTSLYQRVTRLSEFRFWGGSSNTANYNVPMIFNEQNVFKVFERKAKTIQNYFATWHPLPSVPFCISTQSSTDLSSIPDNSIDYIFTDPPFGANINYSEMNFLWESWLSVFTKTENEAIVNRVQGKSIEAYQQIMLKAFSEMKRVLKKGRWLTVMFHNSSASVWSAIQHAILLSGFSIESTQILDKRHGTFKQFVSRNAVGYDLVLHCMKRTFPFAISTALHDSGDSELSIRKFIITVLTHAPENFIVRYLHVDRKDEIDSRKLYSLWLKDQLETKEAINIGYDSFRKILNDVLESEFGGSSTIKTE